MNDYIALPSGGFGNVHTFTFSHPSVPIRREGYIVLTSYKAVRQFVGCLNKTTEGETTLVTNPQTQWRLEFS